MKPGKARMDVMTWQATYGNGVLIGMMGVITAVVQQTIRRGLRQALTVFFAAVRGTAVVTAAVLLVAAGTIPTTGTSASVSGVRLG